MRVMLEIKRMRILAGKTIAQLGKEAGISATHVHNIETGARKASPSVAEEISRLLGIPPEKRWDVFYKDVS
ncbi:hypothetical protein AGMMS49992_26950 [Clostridia bacterium]|nr:hypothetical protein AGMMS49992_26950 [Clostridia bacterium]